MEPQDEHSGHAHTAHPSCPSCWASLRTPLFCETCDELLEAKGELTPFASLGIQEAFPLDRMELRKRLLAYSRAMHPDFHTTRGAKERDLAEHNTAELNAAYEILSDDFRRADWIVGNLGGPADKDERQMPAAFLMEVLEWNEAIDEARNCTDDSAEFQALPPLKTELQEQREDLMQSVSKMLTPLPAVHAPELIEVRRRLNAVRYLDRTLEEIDELLTDRDSA